MAQDAKTRVLKVGLVQDGKLIEELTLKPKTTVGIGQDPENMFVVGGSEWPKKHQLIEHEHDGYHLHLLPGMKGKLSLEEKVYDLEDISNEDIAAKKGKGYTVRLSQNSKGKVIIGDTSILFQLVPPRPQVAPMKLPAELRGGVIRSVDLHFIILLIVSFLFHIGTIRYLNSIEVTEEMDLIIAEKLPKVVLPENWEPPLDEELPEDADLEEKGDDKPKGAEKAGPKGPEEQGLLALITKKGDRGPVADILSEGLGEDIMSAMQNISGVKVARSGDIGTRKHGGGSGKSVDIDNLGSFGKGGSVDMAGKDRKAIKSSIKTDSADIQGKLDRNLIAAKVRTYLAGIKACYEYQLKRDPNLRGKITVRFTIGIDGKVTEATIVSSTLNDQQVKDCMKRRIMRWKFPKPEEGTVTVSYPFIFTAVSGG